LGITGIETKGVDNLKENDASANPQRDANLRYKADVLGAKTAITDTGHKSNG